MSERRYYKATGELASKLLDWANRSRAAIKPAKKFAKRFGGELGHTNATFNYSFIVAKDDSPGPEWKLLNKKQPGFWVPRLSGKAAKLLADELRELESAHPSRSEINDLIGFTTKHQFIGLSICGVGVVFCEKSGFALLTISSKSKYSIPKPLADSGELVRISDIEYEEWKDCK